MKRVQSASFHNGKAENDRYSTAISAAICFEVWSLYFFIKAVYDTPSDNKAIALATLGGLFGALTFGCRPPIALANIIAVPLAIVFIRSRKINGRLNKKLLLRRELSRIFSA